MTRVKRASPKLKMIKGSGNVFLDLGFDKAEADSLKMRADLIRIPFRNVKRG